MNKEQPAPIDPRFEAAAAELAELIKGRYPDASFGLSRSQDDPTIVHLNAVVDVDDTDAVLDLVIDRMMELQYDEDLPLFVIPRRPEARVAELIQSHRQPALRRLASTVPTLDRGRVLSE